MKKTLPALGLLLIWAMTAHAQLLSGPYLVGPGNLYTNLTDVAAVLKTGTLTGDVVFQIQSNYTSATEVFPISFKQTTTSGGNWKVTIQPAGSTSIITEGDAGAGNALINIDSTDRLILDGRAGGSGGIAWIIRNKCALVAPVSPLVPVNTTSAGPVIQFINDATFDTLMYLQLEGMNPVQSSAVVYFGTTTGLTGNSYNGINYCNIRDRSDTTAGTATPAAGILSVGTALNNYNTVSNNNIFNYFYPSSQTHGIRVNNAAGWVIRNNRFFQELPRVFTVSNNHKVIRVDNGAGNTTCTNHLIEGNIIGYSSASGTGYYDVSGLSTVLSGMDLNLATAGNNIVRKNVLSNIIVNTASATNTGSPSGVFAGIGTNQGYFTIDSNIIGSKTDTSSIRIISTGAGFGVYGIAILNKSVTVSNNYVGGITLENPIPGNLRGLFYGIGSTATGGVVTISNNQIGGNMNMPFSILNRTGASNTTAGHTSIGINFSASPTLVTNNSISNIVYQGGSTTAQVIGINSTGTTTAQKIGSNTNGSGNTIFKLLNNAPNTGTGITASVIGILATNTTAGQLVSQNNIYNLINTNTSAATVVIGMHYAGGTTNSGDVVNRNFIHTLSVQSTNTAASVIGLNTATSSATYKNNIIRLGFDSLGNDLTTGYAITGIFNTPSGAGTDNYFHNTVYVGGANVVSGSNTYAFNRNATTNTTNIINNILVNARSNSSGTAANIVLRNNNALNAGLNSNYNVYHRSGTGGILFASSALTFDSICNWQFFNSPVALDANSGAGDPLLNNPTGSVSLLNMFPLASNPIEGMGWGNTGVTDDYNGNSRSLLTPHDIGAVSGNYTRTPDLFAPVISFNLLGAGIIAATRSVTGVSITDNSGIGSGLNIPRFYYKKKSEANVFAGNFSGINGWKYVTASNTSSPYSFTIDYTLLSASAVVGDTIVYFIAAQDVNGNLESSPAGAGYTVNPPIQNINTAPVNGLNFFAFGNNAISGAKTVCAFGCDYPNLTGITGLFHAMDSLAVTGNIQATIMSDLIEDGAYALNNFGSYSLLLIPDATPRTISNSVDLPATTPLIHFSGASNVTIDGGSANNLIFKNTNTTAVNTSTTIQFSNGSANDTLRNCIIQNNGSTATRANIVLGGTNGVSNIVVTKNKITDTVNTSTQQPAVGILSNSASNTNVFITNNEVYNFRSSGISFTSFGTNATISGNHIYNNTVTVPATGFNGINITAGNEVMIDSNYVGGQAPLLGGGTWVFNSNTASFGITTSSPGKCVVQRNRVGFIAGTQSAVVAGISGTGTASPLLIKNNEVHDLTSVGTNGGLFTSLGGILYSSTNQFNSITGNTIYNLYINSASGSPGVSGIGCIGNSSFMAGGEISGNRIYGFQMNPASSITPDIRGIGSIQGSSTIMNITIANNFISMGENITNNVQMEGIWANCVAASSTNIYNNTIYVSGIVASASTVSTAAILKSNTSMGLIRNNILYNTRTKGAAGTAVHTAISNSVLTNPGNAWNCDYNILYASDTATAVVTWGAVNYGFAAWKALLLGDFNTKSKTLFFNAAGSGDLHLVAPTIGDIDLAGTPLVGITNDYDNEARDLYKPYIGADEITGAPLPVKLTGFSATYIQKDVLVNWRVTSEQNVQQYLVEVSTNGSTFKTLGIVKAKGNSQGLLSYQFRHVNANLLFGNTPVIYYRLTSSDNDGNKQQSDIVSVYAAGGTSVLETVSFYPNPFNNNLTLSIAGLAGNELFVEVYDLQGRNVSASVYPLVDGINTISVDGVEALEPGIYFVKTVLNGEFKTQRMIRQ
jgi:hypothetical protein